MLPKRLQLALLIPATGSWQGAFTIAGAAALAIERVNQDDTLLPGWSLEYDWQDSGCSAAQALTALAELEGRTLRRTGGKARFGPVIGPGCSSACIMTAGYAVAHNQPQISYSCTDDTLSDKSKYPLVNPMHVLFLGCDTGACSALLSVRLIAPCGCAGYFVLAVFKDSGTSIRL